MEKLWVWLAWRLPKELVRWASVRLMAHATTTEYAQKEPAEVSILDALRAW